MSEIKHNKEAGNFEVIADGKRAGLMTYTSADDRININHTEIDSQFSGKGLGSKLVEAAVNYAREQNLKIVPTCSFARSTIEKNSSWQDVL